MKNIILITIGLFVNTGVFADDTTVYESVEGGVPTFSDEASPNQNEQSININTAPPSSNNASPGTGTQNEQASQLSQQLQQQNQKLYALQQQLSEAGAALDSAKKSLEKAQTAQDQGQTTIGGDQYLDTNLIRHLQQNVAEAEANYQQALDAYNNYRNNPEQIPN